MLAMKSKDVETSLPHIISGRSRLRLAASLLSSLSGSVIPQCIQYNPLTCPQCQWIPFNPVTLPCGHTSCRECVIDCKLCPQCFSPLPDRLETNVLVKAAVEKWWAPELQASRIRARAQDLVADNLLEQALTECNIALQIAPHDHLLLETRAGVLQRLNRCEAALEDVDLLTKLRPLWPKGHYRKGLVLSSLGNHEDALLSFSLCVALGVNSDQVKYHFLKTLQRFLSPAPLTKNSKTRVPISPWWSYNHNTIIETPKNEEDGIVDSLNKTVISRFPSLGSKRLHIVLDRISEEIEEKRNLHVGVSNIIIRRNLVDVEDFKCVLCLRTLWQPVTTPCGHTYCLMCLERSFDYGPNCPLCVASLSQYFGCSKKIVTEFVESALAMALPDEFSSRLMLNRQELSMLSYDPAIPIFVCTTAFPGVSCPLFVFEPRYRVMVRKAVESGVRQFGIAACTEQKKGVKRYAEYGVVLEIKDVVLLSDGCSILSTVGFKRFRVMSRGEQDGYDTAKVEYIIDDPIPQQSLRELKSLHNTVREKGKEWFESMSLSMKNKVLKTFGEMPKLEPNWINLEDGPAWAWWLIAILPLGQKLQLEILKTTCLEKRLLAIYATLKHVENSPQNIEAVSNSQKTTLKRSNSSVRLT